MAFEATERPHERIGVRYGRILAFVAGFLVFTGVLMTLLGLFYRDRIRSAHIIEPLRAFPGPELQPNPQQDYTNFRTGQDAQLQGYSWVDKDKTLLHVPIDRAMSYVAARASGIRTIGAGNARCAAAADTGGWLGAAVGLPPRRPLRGPSMTLQPFPGTR